MRRVGHWIYILLLLAAVFLGYLFNLENPEPVAVTLVGFPLPQLALGVWLLLFTLVGLLLGLLLGLFPSLGRKRRLSQLTRQNRQLEQEVQLLRSQSLRD
ncbi:lipopolysaccharide assembly protein LapA domain-containing protein [Gilvimarinus algae]|uniref:Lipopolysaccharide assembly protein LapA domain-containing protein n=1 Tax=Gilvimarinus algae TaxID=3058037 RepID=A0ABT8TEN7_9GAMM|nr:lipopolysaccharide assembly protein LapA domain-containing protein [Gilvimarinus sp. SDUM040014]MDO3382549.1 lipopolysaccharide assembly protein LapA domain-containing protein [Gilvimarinus sp. SDUM040014]